MMASTLSLMRMPSRRDSGAKLAAGEPNSPNSSQTLIDRLIDSQSEWRQLIREANESVALERALSEQQIKRQELIHELIQTERHHCLTLALMRQVYLSGLRQLNEQRTGAQADSAGGARGPNSRSSSIVSSAHESLAAEPVDLERLFPALEDLVQAHELFFAHLRLKLVESCQASAQPTASCRLIGVVGQLGSLLRDQFRLRRPIAAEQQQAAAATTQLSPTMKIPAPGDGGEQHQQQPESIPSQQSGFAHGNGHKLLQAYAKFCGSHADSSRYYKHLMQSDKGFKQFIENCNKQHPICRQRGIPECNLLVTQRLTKYPLLLEQLIKSSKDDPEEEQNLRLALAECKALLAELNQQLARKESFERLLDIYAQFCPKSSTLYNNNLRFTKHDLLQHKRLRQLIHTDDQVRIWSATRRKLFQVLCLILNDIVVFLRVESPANGAGNGLGGGSGAPLASSALLGSSSAASMHNLVQSSPWSFEPPPPPGDHSNWLPQAPTGNNGQSTGGGTLISAVANALHSAAAGAPGGALGGQLPVPLGASSAASGPSGISVKYCFANIDNKSSVISLGKLLIRDKAANEAEPRTYLISSSPRQPEMYELAFVSRRHQANFVDKLKGCIEQYNRNAANRLNSNQLEEEEEEEEFCDEFDLIDELDHIDLDADYLVDVDFECDHEQFGSNLELDDHDDDNDTADHEATRAQTPQSDVTAKPAPEDRTSEAAAESTSGAKTSPSASSSSSCCQSRAEDSSGELDPADLLASNESGLSEKAKDSMDEGAQPSRQRMRGARRRRLQRPRNVSNQSSSSSEVAHRQAIELMSGSATSAKPVSSTPRAARGAATDEDEEFDSGRGHDDSSSTSSNKSTAGQPLKVKGETEASSLAPTSTKDMSLGSGASSIASDSTATNETTTGSSNSSAAKSRDEPSLKPTGADCSAAANNASGATYLKSSLAAAKQRKLSTVSTMSSQLKLLNKLRSLAAAHGLAESGAGCPSQSANQSRRSVCMGSPSACNRHQETATLTRQLRQQIRRSSYIPEQKLEELRDLQLQLERDKREWQVKFERMQEQLLDERRELDLAREKLRQDRHQVANEREQLYRKLDVLKEKGILLSPSHNVIITTPELRHLDSHSVLVHQQPPPVVRPGNQQQVVYSPSGADHRLAQFTYCDGSSLGPVHVPRNFGAATTTISLGVGGAARQQPLKTTTTLLMNPHLGYHQQQQQHQHSQVPLHLSESNNRHSMVMNNTRQ